MQTALGAGRAPLTGGARTEMWSLYRMGWQSLQEDARDTGWRLMKITFLFQSSVLWEACLKMVNSAQLKRKPLY